MNKYHNIKTEIDNIIFSSRKEANRYQELILLKRAGQIDYLELQPKYEIKVNGVNIGFYKADFRYTDMVTGKSVVEDVKSPATRTPVYMLKKKLVEAIYGIEIVEL